MKYIKTYCLNCGQVTTHGIYTEDAYGAHGISRIFTTIISCGISLLDCHTFCKCLSCGNVTEL